MDVLSPVGHRNYNYSLLDIFTELGEIDVAIKKGHLKHYKKEKLNNVYNIPEYFFNRSNKSSVFRKLYIRIKLFIEMQWIKKLIRKKHYDIIFFSSMEPISFFFSTLRLRKRYLFVDHGIGQINDSKVKRFFWKNINNKAEPIVMEKYIKKFLKKEIKIKNKVWVLPHPLPKLNIKETSTPYKRKIIFAPSGSNNEEFISFLISNVDRINNYKVIIKSKNKILEHPNLKVYNDRITNKEYYSFMKNSSYVLLPYEDHYNYRVSGVLFEAVKLNKPIIINSNNTLKYYTDKYPKSVLSFKDFEEFFIMLKKIKNEKNIIDNSEIKKEHSKAFLKIKLNKILKYDN